jgi:purine-nucleoside/S-methyl-5'-thioadenosine phosphorylase / adenosine deaminase
MLEVISSPLFDKIPHLKHGMFTRNGGVSTGCNASLNCYPDGKDELNNVRENIRRAMEHIHCSVNSSVSIKCVHGNEVVIVNEVWKEDEKPKADAMITTKVGIVLASTTADCPVVLLVDKKVPMIAWIHAGWRSAKAGIIEETIKKMKILGASHENIIATICPSIEQKSYEVDLEFYKLFIEEHPDNARFFKSTQKENHQLFDLKGYVRNRLMSLHIKDISVMEHDTYSEENYFFSCRRARHNAESDFGGNLSFIALNI